MVRRNGVTRAYPLQILIWHEIVNDIVGGDPITVTYCPLCNTTLAFDRRFDGRVLDFGTTGRLRHSDLIMYDRQTGTWWQQATGQGIVGEYAGRQLTFVSSPVMRWEDVMDSRSVGSSAVYAPEVDGRLLSFESAADDGMFRDQQTGTLWNIMGQGVEGALVGRQLTEVPHGNHFWFAWAVFRPETKIWRP